MNLNKRMMMMFMFFSSSLTHLSSTHQPDHLVPCMSVQKGRLSTHIFSLSCTILALMELLLFKWSLVGKCLSMSSFVSSPLGQKVQNFEMAEQWADMTGGVRWRKLGIFIISALAYLEGTTWALVWIMPCLAPGDSGRMESPGDGPDTPL